MATPAGVLSTGIVAITLFAARTDHRDGVGVVIRYVGEVPIGGDGHAKGATTTITHGDLLLPTGIVATTVLLAVAITETVLGPVFTT
jgi:hypothetical protein